MFECTSTRRCPPGRIRVARFRETVASVLVKLDTGSQTAVVSTSFRNFGTNDPVSRSRRRVRDNAGTFPRKFEHGCSTLARVARYSVTASLLRRLPNRSLLRRAPLETIPSTILDPSIRKPFEFYPRIIATLGTFHGTGNLHGARRLQRSIRFAFTRSTMRPVFEILETIEEYSLETPTSLPGLRHDTKNRRFVSSRIRCYFLIRCDSSLIFVAPIKSSRAQKLLDSLERR